MTHRTIALGLVALVASGCSMAGKQKMAATTLPADWSYSQDFSAGSNWNADHDGVKLTWHDGMEWNGNGALRLVKSGNDSIIAINVADLGYTRATISFKYYHLQIQHDPANMAGSKLQVRVGTDDDSAGNMTDGMYRTVCDLNATTADVHRPVFSAAGASVDLKPGDKVVYWKIVKGNYPRALLIDDVTIALTAAGPKK